MILELSGDQEKFTDALKRGHETVAYYFADAEQNPNIPLTCSKPRRLKVRKWGNLGRSRLGSQCLHRPVY